MPYQRYTVARIIPRPFEAPINYAQRMEPPWPFFPSFVLPLASTCFFHRACFFQPLLPWLLLFSPFSSPCIFKRIASNASSALFVLLRRRFPVYVIIILRWYFPIPFHLSIDLHGYPIVFRGNGIRWQGRDYFPIGYFYALSSLPSSYSHLIDQQGPVPSSNKCFPGLPTTFLSIPSHGDISVEIARRVANDRKGWRENEGKGRGDRRGMNKIGDLEYFALGSSGHFTRHFNP